MLKFNNVSEEVLGEMFKAMAIDIPNQFTRGREPGVCYEENEYDFIYNELEETAEVVFYDMFNVRNNKIGVGYTADHLLKLIVNQSISNSNYDVEGMKERIDNIRHAYENGNKSIYTEEEIADDLEYFIESMKLSKSQELDKSYELNFDDFFGEGRNEIDSRNVKGENHA